MNEFTNISLVVFLILSLVAETLGTVGGFGSSTFFVPIANYFLDFQSVLAITSLYHIFSNGSKLAFFRKGIDKRTILYLGLPAIIFAFVGSFLSKFLDKPLVTLLLSIFLISTSLFLIIKHNLTVETNVVNSTLGGGLSGFLAGLLGTGGAVRGVAMSAFNLEKDVFVATSAVIDMGIDLSRMIIYLVNGFIHRDDLLLLPFLLVISIAGTYVGKKILAKIPQEKFKIIVLALILIVGILTLIQYFFSILKP